ncbi:MAG: 30S ribosomal protein S24e [Candidatus Pacearchaeota archaeon]|nr:30S ribosomal protein S24e [Candidatus Pacearchaeota archaeon]
MSRDIIKDFKNDLLKRREVKVVIKESKNPGFERALKIIAEQFNANEENIVIKELKSKFGRDTFLIDAFIYDSVEDKNRIEPKKKEKKKSEGAVAQTQAAAGGK